MRLFLLILVGLGAGVAIGWFASIDRGYMLVIWNGWQVVFPNLVLILVAVIIGFILLHYLLNVVRQLGYWRRGVSHWSANRRANKARDSLVSGLIALAEGRWRKGEKLLLKHVTDADAPLIHYLGAARAAEEQDATERRDQYLALAHELDSDAQVAIHLSQAGSYLRHGQMEQALATLQELHKMEPGQTQVLEKLARVYQSLNDWQGLHQMLPLLKKKGIFDADHLRLLEENCLVALLRQSDGDDSGALDQLWRKVPKPLKERAALIKVRVNQLRQQERTQEAIALLKNSLDNLWDQDLLLLYGQLESENKALQLKTAEAWLEEHPDDDLLLLVLGKLCERLALWGKARSYLASSVAKGGSIEARSAFGELLLKLEEPDAALKQFRDGLSAAVKQLGSALPAS